MSHLKINLIFWLALGLNWAPQKYDYDDAEYIGIRDIGNLFNQPTDEGYYKPIKTKSAFNGNYIEYESNGNQDKNSSPENILIQSDCI